MNIFESVSFLNESYDIQVMNEFAISKFIDKLKNIKKSRPDEYTENEEVKKFVDKYHDDLIEVADILEKEPKSLRKAELASLAGYTVSMIGSVTAMAGMSVNSIIIASLGGIGMVVSIVSTIIGSIIVYIRSNKDVEALNDLAKIKVSLKKALNKEGLNEDVKRKISKIITKINDAEIEYSDSAKA